MIYIIGLLVFIVTVMLLEGLFLLWRESGMEQSRKIEHRVRAMSAGGGHGAQRLALLRNEKLSPNDLVHRFLSAIPRVHALDRALQQAGANLTVVRFIGIQAVIFALCLVAILFSVPVVWPLAVLIALTVAVALPLVFVRSMQRKRQKKFTEQLPDALTYMARGLRAGNPFTASIKSVAEEMKAPMGEEFGVTFDEINYGLSVEDALYNLGDRVGTEEIRFFIIAVVIQKQTGGNLAEVLERLSQMMRKRNKVFRDIQTMSAQMRLSANILIILPFAMAGMIWVLNPGYMSLLLKEPGGYYIIAAQIVLMAIGYWIMRKMIQIRV